MSVKRILTKALIDLISDISEEQYCAGWMSGVEFDIWALINGEQSLRFTWGLSEAQIESLEYFSKNIDGWVRFPEDGNEVVYVPMDMWLDLYKLEKKLREAQK